MASCVRLLFLVVSFCCCSGRASSFIEVECDKTNMGQFDHQSMLMCVVKPKQYIKDLKITLVVWRKTGIEKPVAVLDRRPDKEDKILPGYELPSNNMNVSLLITNTKVEDEGRYTCNVMTDSGSASNTAILKVTAKYSTPTVVDQKRTPNSDKTLICEASGGYPEGQLRWFDEHNMEWTKSAEQTVNKTMNGLLMLSSKLSLKKGSTFSEYTCVVYNASGIKENWATINLDNGNNDSSLQTAQKTSLSAIIAPAVVIGSLIVGLLMALLFFRRRSQKKNRRPSTAPLMGTHHEVSHSDPDVDPPPPYCAKMEDSIA